MSKTPIERVSFHFGSKSLPSMNKMPSQKKHSVGLPFGEIVLHKRSAGISFVGVFISDAQLSVKNEIVSLSPLKTLSEDIMTYEVEPWSSL